MLLTNNEYNILSSLIFLLFTGYILGEAIINLFLVINFIFIFYIIIKNFNKYKFDYISIALIFFFFFYLVSLGLFTSENSFLKNFAYIRFIILAAAIMFLINSDNNKKFIYYLLLISLGFISVDAIYQSIFGHNLFGFEKNIERRLTGIFDDEEVLGSFLSKFFLLCAIIFCSFRKSKLESYLFYFFSIIILITIYLSAERLAIFAITIFLGTFLLLQFKKNIHKFYFLILSSLILFTFVNTSEHLKINVMAKTLSQIGFNKISYYIVKNSSTYDEWGIYVQGYEELDELTDITPQNFIYDKFGIQVSSKNIYDAHYTTAKNIWKDNYWFGAGVKSFSKNCSNVKYELIDHPYNKVKCTTHPHNIYFQILSEIGLVGFILFSLIIIYIIFKNLKNIFESKKNILSMLGLIIIFLPLPSGNFFSTWYGSIFWIFLGFNFNNFLFKKPYKTIK